MQQPEGHEDTMPAELAGAGTGAKILVDVARPGLSRLRMYFRGKKVVIVGPPRSGKSTFADYMHYGVFDPEQNSDVTLRPRPARNFKFKLGREGALFTSIKRATDMPGQPDPQWVAEEALRERPHALIVVLDATAPIDDEGDPRSTAAWLRKFTRAAEQTARGMSGRRNRLRTVVVALNKADQVTAAQFAAQEAGCREELAEWRASGSGARKPQILKCISVCAPGRSDGRSWINAVLSDVAIGLREG